MSSTFTANTTQGGDWTGATLGEVLNYTGPGSYNVTYTVGSEIGGACTDTDNATITVTAAPVADWDGASVCTTSDPIDLDNYLTSSSTTGGTWLDGGNGSGITAAGVLDPSSLPAGTYPIIYRVNGSGACPTVTHEDIIVVNECGSACADLLLDLNPQFSDICTGGNIILGAVISQELRDLIDPDCSGSPFDQNLILFGYDATVGSFPSNPYQGALVTTLGAADGVGGNFGDPIGNCDYEAVLSTNLPANTTCEPQQRIVYAYFDVAVANALGLDATCRPFVSEIVTVWPDPSAMSVAIEATDGCTVTLDASCAGYTVDPETVIIAEGSSGSASQAVTIEAPAGSPCSDFGTTINLSGQTCVADCPAINAIQLDAGNQFCSVATGVDILANLDVAAVNEGIDVIFAYDNGPTFPSDPYSFNSGFTTLATTTPVLESGETPLARATVNFPANTTCDPVIYMVYAYYDEAALNAAGLSPNCRPFATTQVIIWPNPATNTINVAYDGCNALLTPSCSGMTVTPSIVNIVEANSTTCLLYTSDAADEW